MIESWAKDFTTIGQFGDLVSRTAYDRKLGH